MVEATIEHFNAVALKKIAFLKQSIGRYFIFSMMAGAHIGFAITLIFAIGGPFKAANDPALKALMGASFGIALALVIFAGSELFTGNNMTLMIASLSKKVTWRDTLWLWLVCYLGNLAGSLLLAYGVAASGIMKDSPGGALVLTTAAAKMQAPWMELFVRGILCNMLVCLAVWTAARTKDDTAKLLLIFWCLFAFIGSGFEHSIANMSLLGIGLFIPHDPTAVSWAGYARNLIPVTLGNVVGGAVFIGAAYWYVANLPKTTANAKEII